MPFGHFEGTLKEAQDTALRANVKNRLPMTREAKAEAAWRMLLMGREDPAWARSWTQITDATYVSRSTVKRMARTLKEQGPRPHGEPQYCILIPWLFPVWRMDLLAQVA